MKSRDREQFLLRGLDLMAEIGGRIGKAAAVMSNAQ